MACNVAAPRASRRRRFIAALFASIVLTLPGDAVRGGSVASVAGDLDLFPTGYDQSRLRFRQSCAAALARHAGNCRSFSIPSGSEGDLTIDDAFLTAHGSRLLVVQSGIHGPESYAGAAAQALLLRDFADRLLDRGVDLLLIHALNPYGFRHDRRADEANVNLNRNFSPDGSIYRLDAPRYAALRWVFEPEGKPGSLWWDSLLSHLRFLWALVASGFDYRLINDAMNQGQYRFERGLNYGGNGPRPHTGWPDRPSRRPGE